MKMFGRIAGTTFDMAHKIYGRLRKLESNKDHKEVIRMGISGFVVFDPLTDGDAMPLIFQTISFSEG
ncbi:hypothetical protein TRAPUB_4181 [Trametes pubescens]|uniref:Uncharacterized protein n=1 Tax=Trametes pubescens TaxID=154538 RepID=A0A1M2VBU2_TRAPU|nr:hypothetical protein TRAPUB_4181 [Trametes pubescens]